MPVTRTIPVRDADVVAPRSGPAATDRFEAPLSTVPFPLARCVDACMDTRDLDLDEGLAPFSRRSP